MRTLLLLVVLIIALGFGIAYAAMVAPQPDGSVFIVLSAEEAQACKAEGGCAVVSAAGFQQAVLQACGSRT